MAGRTLPAGVVVEQDAGFDLRGDTGSVVLVWLHIIRFKKC